MAFFPIRFGVPSNTIDWQLFRGDFGTANASNLFSISRLVLSVIDMCESECSFWAWGNGFPIQQASSVDNLLRQVLERAPVGRRRD